MFSPSSCASFIERAYITVMRPSRRHLPRRAACAILNLRSAPDVGKPATAGRSATGCVLLPQRAKKFGGGARLRFRSSS